jgi:hypothetical protein
VEILYEYHNMLFLELPRGASWHRR